MRAEQEALTKEERRLAHLAALLLPLRDVTIPSTKKKSPPTPVSAVRPVPYALFTKIIDVSAEEAEVQTLTSDAGTHHIMSALDHCAP